MIFRFSFEEGDYEAEVDITPGSPQRGPTYDCGGTPAEPAEIEVIKVWMIEDDGRRTPMADFDTIAEWLMTEKEDDILEQADDDKASAMEDEADRRRDQMNEDRYDR